MNYMLACEHCGKGTVLGKNSAHKHGGGWAMRAPSTKKVWKPNLQKFKTTLKGVKRTYWLCTKCIKRIKRDSRPVEAKVEVMPSPVVPSTA
ncbi:MAG TPA: L28 family ribosomal protein [Patescibacteria group bacterium]